MIFILFHLLGLLFLIFYYKLKITIWNIAVVLGLFTVYYFTLPDTSFLAMLIYSWSIYFINTYILSKNYHTAYHVSIIVIIVGLFMSYVVNGDAFYFYQYMHVFSFESMAIMVGHFMLMSGVLILRKKLLFYKEPLYLSKFSVINLFVHFQIVIIHLLRDLDFVNRRISHDDSFYYRSIFFGSFAFYLLLIISGVFYENKRSEEKELFTELQLKQNDLRYLLETRPYCLIEELKELGAKKDYDALLKETSKYIGYKKKVAHKRVLDKLGDELLAYATMETISDEKDVAFEIVVESKTTDMLSKKHYFLEMYKIVLDNAVEAAKNANLRYVKIVFDQHKVMIENSYSKEDVNQLLEKASLKGEERRINGLKLLDYLKQESNINVTVTVSYRVIVQLEVEYA